MELKELAKLAVDVRKNAYAPYSKFHVGAALLTADGKVYTGVNIESASYTPTCCAERTAFAKAVSEGERNFVAIAVAGGFMDKEAEYCYPCGVCRQVMVEFCNPKTFKVIMAKTGEEFKEHLLDEILPYSFGPSDLA